MTTSSIQPPKRRNDFLDTPFSVLLIEANYPLVCAAGGENVTEEFFDNDQRIGALFTNAIPYYDFIHGEPYSKWY